ncbi:MAG TPA: ATP-binding protein, partial [Anaerolineae bacterium]|nr:ATP-binding protein [Anaerolineae bacterium]
MQQPFEKVGAFYLGKEYDLEAGERLDDLVMYDARDLTTHAVVVGMTGSGKTGLCIDILEEAAIDHVPAIIIDPKGDITNLLLTFPDLRPEDFQPWVNIDDARRKGMSIEEYAAKMAEVWRKGLAEWGEGPERIRMLKESAEFLIYTPGSDAGLPISILASLKAPQLDWESNKEILREQIQGTVSALLGLVKIDADPLRSREHILLSNIFEYYWQQGEDLDMAKLIMAIQNPPITKLGVFDVETFFPQKDRFELAMDLNAIMAAPSFQSWLEGDPLDMDTLLYNEGGKPRHSIFYIAHLSDSERMFFVTLLLEQLVTWMRQQKGTTSLRALMYMDEVFGFFPPIGEPPSKKPLLTLMKQARAYGLGVILTTQNPADLDYKGLTNAGTWFIGKLQAERDKERMLAGLESASSGSALNKSQLRKIISSLDSRVFLLHNVHEDEPVIFQTRWAMSYLRGPLSREQVAQLMAPVKQQAQAAGPAASAAA